jgi:hypothetical protein
LRPAATAGLRIFRHTSIPRLTPTVFSSKDFPQSAEERCEMVHFRIGGKKAMQISRISSITPTSPVLLTLNASPATRALPAIVSPASPTPNSAATPTAAPATAAAQRAPAHTAAPAATNGIAASTPELLAAFYSTSVVGKQYTGSVEQTGSQYTVSIPSLPGATATGSSVLAAENTLTNKIDLLV